MQYKGQPPRVARAQSRARFARLFQRRHIHRNHRNHRNHRGKFGSWPFPQSSETVHQDKLVCSGDREVVRGYRNNISGFLTRSCPAVDWLFLVDTYSCRAPPAEAEARRTMACTSVSTQITGRSVAATRAQFAHHTLTVIQFSTNCLQQISGLTNSFQGGCCIRTNTPPPPAHARLQAQNSHSITHHSSCLFFVRPSSNGRPRLEAQCIAATRLVSGTGTTTSTCVHANPTKETAKHRQPREKVGAMHLSHRPAMAALKTRTRATHRKSFAFLRPIRCLVEGKR